MYVVSYYILLLLIDDAVRRFSLFFSADVPDALQADFDVRKSLEERLDIAKLLH